MITTLASSCILKGLKHNISHNIFEQNIHYIIAATNYLVAAVVPGTMLDTSVITLIRIKIQNCRKLQMRRRSCGTSASYCGP